MIAIHTSPDLDCIAGAWLLQRYGGLGDAEVVFVNTGQPDPSVLTAAAAVVDTGKVFDAERLRFDHHQDPALPSAAMLVYEHLRAQGAAPAALRPLISLIDAADRGVKTPETETSRRLGIHALLSAAKARRLPDAELYALGCGWLDDLATGAVARAEAAAMLAAMLGAVTVYRSSDGLFVALLDAPPAATWAAIEAGARLVLFADTARNAIGVQRGGEWAEPHVGELVAAVEASVPGGDLAAELSRWFRHPAGFFAGRGTAKAPSDVAVSIDVATLAERLDGAWRRS